MSRIVGVVLDVLRTMKINNKLRSIAEHREYELCTTKWGTIFMFQQKEKIITMSGCILSGLQQSSIQKFLSTFSFLLEKFPPIHLNKFNNITFLSPSVPQFIYSLTPQGLGFFSNMGVFSYFQLERLEHVSRTEVSNSNVLVYLDQVRFLPASLDMPRWTVLDLCRSGEGPFLSLDLPRWKSFLILKEAFRIRGMSPHMT